MTKRISTLDAENRELRYVRLDQGLSKFTALEAWLNDLEKDATDYYEAAFNDLMPRMAEQIDPTEDLTGKYDALSRNQAQTLASIQAARENIRCALIHVSLSQFKGHLTDLINIEAIRNESKKL
ncbi:hypothetical protein F418_p55 [Hafnia phage Enc34]|uniref:Uncharacterized protein n=1 Tax=Hafnia phage Enc34 TaxID=1150990 RepID=H6WYL7_9CAUD|nr:hypothetical protein F418_p55 [Hafnia phage Enc34]AFB84072.1 hypothetical protein [Hafnia phage Enc34]